MKKLFSSIIFLVGSALLSAQSAFYTREINIADDHEVSKVAQLLMSDYKRIYDEKTKKYRDKTEDELQSDLIKIKKEVIQNQGKEQHLFVCLSTQDGRLAGMLHCKYGHRKLGMVEIMDVEFYKDQSWMANICFWSKDNSDEVKLLMIQYAENFYKQLSMKSIITLHPGKNEKLYLDSGYRILTKKEADQIITSLEVVGNVFGSFFAALVLPFLTFGLCRPGDVLEECLNSSFCVYYKEL